MSWFAIGLVALILAGVAISLAILTIPENGRFAGWLRRDSQPRGNSDSLQVTLGPAPEPARARAYPVLEQELAGVKITPGLLLMIEHPFDPGLALVLGSDEIPSEFGDAIGPVPGQLAEILVGADVMVKAGISAGEQSGMLVRVYSESAKALREGQRVFDSSGKMLPLVKNTNGKITHVLRLAPSTGVQVLSAATGILSAVAMQAQLSSIERKLQKVLEGVQDVQESLSRSEEAQIIGVERTLSDVYNGARTAGTLDQTAWDQIAPLGLNANTNRANAEIKVGALLDKLLKLKSTGDRHAWFKSQGPELERAYEQLARAQRSLIQFQALKLWRLSIVNDPTVGHYARQLEESVAAAGCGPSSLQSKTVRALEYGSKTWQWDHIHSPKDSKRIKRQSATLLRRLEERNLIGFASSIEVMSIDESSQTEAAVNSSHRSDDSAGGIGARGF